MKISYENFDFFDIFENFDFFRIFFDVNFFESTSKKISDVEKKIGVEIFFSIDSMQKKYHLSIYEVSKAFRAR